MNYWWVNHKLTFRQEFGGGYVWCPKKKKHKDKPEGITNHFYETMREVQAGDFIFSYANAAIQGFGIAKTPCYSCPKPDDFGKVGSNWATRGWRVDVNFTKLAKPFRTMDHIDLIRPHLPQKYSPINLKSGGGNEAAYFSEISKTCALVIANLADTSLIKIIKSNNIQEGKPTADVSLTTIQDWEDQEQRFIESNDQIDNTTRKALVHARVGQGKFKRKVSEYELGCRVTKVTYPAHLIASHIKPWRESNNEERLAGGNGLLLTPSIDHLFDRGFISFEDNGDLISSPRADTDSLVKMGVDTSKVINVGSFNSDQKHFLDHHRNEILLKSAK